MGQFADEWPLGWPTTSINNDHLHQQYTTTLTWIIMMLIYNLQRHNADPYLQPPPTPLLTTTLFTYSLQKHTDDDHTHLYTGHDCRHIIKPRQTCHEWIAAINQIYWSPHMHIYLQFLLCSTLDIGFSCIHLVKPSYLCATIAGSIGGCSHNFWGWQRPCPSKVIQLLTMDADAILEC